jgi:hypothetical protein
MSSHLKPPIRLRYNVSGITRIVTIVAVGERDEQNGGAVRGDFGNSIWQNRPASVVVIERLPATALPAVVTVIFTWAVAVPPALIVGRCAGG